MPVLVEPSIWKSCRLLNIRNQSDGILNFRGCCAPQHDGLLWKAPFYLQKLYSVILQIAIRWYRHEILPAVSEGRVFKDAASENVIARHNRIHVRGTCEKGLRILNKNSRLRVTDKYTYGLTKAEVLEP